MLMSSLSDRAGFLIVGTLVKYAVGFCMPIILVRLLSQTEYGTYQQLLLLGNTALGVMTLGLPTSVYYFYHHVTKDKIPTLIAQTSLALGISGVLVALAFALGAPLIARSMNNPPMAELLRLYAISTAFMIASDHSMHFMIAQDRYQKAVGFEIGEILLRVMVLLGPLWLGYGLWGLVGGIVFYSALRFVVRGLYLLLASRVRFAGWHRSTFLADQLGYSVPIGLSVLAALLANAFNRALLAVSFTPRDFAIYSVGALEIPLDAIFQASVSNVLRATLPPLVRDGNVTEVVRVLRGAVRRLAIIVLPSFVFLYAYSDQFISLLFTTRYAAGTPVFRIYLLALPLAMFVLSPVPPAYGKTRLALYINLVTVSFTVVSSYALLKMVGFYGPAIAAVAAQYFQVVLFIVVIRRLIKASVWEMFPIPEALMTVLVALISLLAARVGRDLTHSPLLNLLISAIAFSVTFLPLSALLGVLNIADRALIRRWVLKALPAKPR